MANEQNLKSISERSASEQREMRSKGGINSGKTRKQKADLRKMAQEILDGTFKDKNGKQVSGKELVLQGLISNLADSKGRNWGKAMDMLVELTGSGMTNEQKAKLKAETALIKAKVKETENAAANITESASDNFLDALNGTAEDVWNGENDDETETEADSDI